MLGLLNLPVLEGALEGPVSTRRPSPGGAN